MSDNQEITHNADAVRTIEKAIHDRACRESLWDMPLDHVDLEAMAYEIAEALRLTDEYGTPNE